jgi:hypothetical protein
MMCLCPQFPALIYYGEGRAILLTSLEDPAGSYLAHIGASDFDYLGHTRDRVIF